MPFIDELMVHIDIADVVGYYVHLTPKGAPCGVCPLPHGEGPSFSVSRDNQNYHCFGCGKEGGDGGPRDRAK